mmetsp:Transcript_34298/g.30112  ORF Transcript_34298/g.30112 Transcript_34298/m.30112 type:complete len:228 (-) Transcript_34298:220-903(-)
MAAPNQQQLAALQKMMQGQGQCKKIKKAGTIAKSVNLNDLIKTCKVLNRSDEDSTISDLMFGKRKDINNSQYIMSDADEELLILIEFREDIDLETISFHACKEEKDNGDDDEDEDEDDDEPSYSAPKQIFIYAVDSLNKDFDDALAAKPDIKLICDGKKLKSGGGQKVKLKKKAKQSIKFGKVDKIMIYITSNQDDTDQTYISGIKFEGNSSAKTDMSRWNDVKCKS